MIYNITVMNILMENLFAQNQKQKHLMIYVKYVSMKENKNLLKLNVAIKYAQNALNNLNNKNNINYVHFVDNMIGMKFNVQILIVNESS